MGISVRDLKCTQPRYSWSKALELHHFHTQWRYMRNENPRILLDPRRVEDRYAIEQQVVSDSTRREPLCI
jgi:hypothetical protein